MKPASNTVSKSERRILHQIRKVKKSFERTKNNNRKTGSYGYLRSVLRAYNYLADNGLLNHLVEIAPCVLMSPIRSGQHSIRTIIDATCDRVDQRMKSRWTRALEYAVKRDISPADLICFLKANNGIAGCADLASKTRIGSGLRPSKHGNQNKLIAKRGTSRTLSML